MTLTTDLDLLLKELVLVVPQRVERRWLTVAGQVGLGPVPLLSGVAVLAHQVSPVIKNQNDT